MRLINLLRASRGEVGKSILAKVSNKPSKDKNYLKFEIQFWNHLARWFIANLEVGPAVVTHEASPDHQCDSFKALSKANL